MNRPEQRSAVLVEARRWIGTPYHHMGRIRGVGVDCATFPAEVYAAAGAIPPVQIEFYPPDWHLHSALRPDQSRPKGPGEIDNHERYLAQVTEHAIEVERPDPATSSCGASAALLRTGPSCSPGRASSMPWSASA
jgi:hypothetical protein